MTSSAPSVFPLWNSMPECTRIVQTSPVLLGLSSSASPLNASLKLESKPTRVSQPVTMRAWSGRLTMFCPSMKSFVEPPETPRRNVPPRFGIAASKRSMPASAVSPNAPLPRMTTPPAAARRRRSALVSWSEWPWASWSVIVSPPWASVIGRDYDHVVFESRGHCAMLVCMLQRPSVGGTVSRSLDSLFSPRSVAVVGASRDPAKWGGQLARGALKGRHRRIVGLVNRSGGEILGSASHRTLAELPDAPELVVACVPAAAFEQTVDEALDVGARAIVGISAGVGEAEERALGRRVRDGDAILLGPNCLGVFDRDAELDLAPWVDFPPGEIGLIAQSGNLSLELALLAARERLGFSRFASLGNQADLEAAELVESFARHPTTKLIALYVEDFRDGRAFARAAEAAGKPVVLLTVGGSEAGVRAARSHTRALASDLAVVDAACRAAGIVRVSTPRELIEVAKPLLSGKRLRGRRLVVLGDGGGHGVVAADVAAQHGLELPLLSTSLAAELATVLPETATTQNPVDFAGGGEQDVRTFERVVQLLLDSGEAD